MKIPKSIRKKIFRFVVMYLIYYYLFTFLNKSVKKGEKLNNIDLFTYIWLCSMIEIYMFEIVFYSHDFFVVIQGYVEKFPAF